MGAMVLLLLVVIGRIIVPARIQSLALLVIADVEKALVFLAECLWVAAI